MILAIYGTGGTGREVRDMVATTPGMAGQWQKVIFVDDTRPAGTYDGNEVWPLADAVERYGTGELRVVIAVGEPRVKEILLGKVRAAGLTMTNIIHPDAFIAPDAVLGHSVIAKKGAIVSSKAQVGTATCLEAYCSVGHDVTVGDCCQLSNFVAIGGFATIGRCTYIGLGTPVKDRVHVGEWCIVSMASAVIRSIPDGMIAVGNPARPMKRNEEKTVFKE